MRWHTVCRLILAIGLLSVVGLVGASPAQACACGGFVAGDGARVGASGEYAVLTQDGATEQVLLSMDTLANTADAALLIPTPTRAEARLAEATVFPGLDRLIAPAEVVEYRWWPRWNRGNLAGAPQAAAGAPPVSVLETKRLGNLEVTTLAADDAKALASWLGAHGYVMRKGLAAALRPYVADGWFYTAIRLTTPSQDLSGALQPIELRFASDQLVYPMRLSAAAETPQFVRTFVFADHQLQRSDPTARKGDVRLRFAGRIDPGAVTGSSLGAIVRRHPYLTVIDQNLYDPGRQVVSDFTFEQAPTDTAYRPTTYVVRTRTILGVAAGPVLLVVAVLVVNVVVAAALIWHRRRSDAV